MNGKEFEGKVLRVETAKRSKPHDPTPGQYKGPTGGSVKYDQRGRFKPGYGSYQFSASKGGDNVDDRRRSHRTFSRDKRSNDYGYDYRTEPRGYQDRIDRGTSDRPASRHYSDPYCSDPYYDDYERRGRGSYPSNYDDLRRRDYHDKPRSRSRDRREKYRCSMSPRRYDRPRSPYERRR